MIISKETFTKGDWIVHAFYGLGQITGEDEKTIDGEKQIYFKVKTPDSQYWIPVTDINSERIRPIASKNQLKSALTLIQKPPEDLPTDFKERGKIVYQAVKDISLFSKAAMIRDLNGKKFSTKLNLGEIDILNQLKEQFLSEWKMVLNEDSEDLKKRLNEALKTSTGKSAVRL